MASLQILNISKENLNELGLNYFWELPFEIVSTALKKAPSLPTDEVELRYPKGARIASFEILNVPNFWKGKNVNTEIVCTAFNFADEDITKEKAKFLFELEDEFWTLNFDIFSQVLKFYSEKLNDFFLSQLDTSNLETKKPQQISAVLRVLDDAEIKRSIALYFLKYQKDSNLTHECLKAFSSFDNPPSEVIDEVIKRIKIGSSKVEKYFYSNHYQYILLHSIGFHNIAEWVLSCQEILNDWRKYDRILISQILYSHYDHPNKTVHICREILDNWIYEMKRKVFLVKKEYAGQHVATALKNSRLSKGYVLDKAKEIKNKNEELDIPELLMSAVDEILEEESEMRNE